MNSAILLTYGAKVDGYCSPMEYFFSINTCNCILEYIMHNTCTYNYMFHRPIWQFSGVSILSGPLQLSEEAWLPHLRAQQCGDHAEICAQCLRSQVQ